VIYSVKENALKILVTGGAGFIGSHLVDKLLEKGQQVTVLDTFQTGSEDNLIAHKNLKIINQDLALIPLSTLEDIIIESDIVYHLASVVGVALVDEIKDAGMHTNLIMATKLFPIIEKYQKKLVFTSTSEVYGSRNYPCNENHYLTVGPPTKLRWSYACAKLMQEFMIHSYSFPFVIARLFNVTGPRQSWKYGMVLPKFIRAVKAGEPLKVYGSGEQTRCFCHIKDCTEVLYEMGIYRECDGEIVNIGTAEEISMKKLAEKVIRLSKSNSVIDYVPYEKEFSKQHDDIFQRVPDVHKMKLLLGYETKLFLDDIIQDML